MASWQQWDADAVEFGSEEKGSFFFRPCLDRKFL
jgi:hypothetical protein